MSEPCNQPNEIKESHSARLARVEYALNGNGEKGIKAKVQDLQDAVSDRVWRADIAEAITGVKALLDERLKPRTVEDNKRFEMKKLLATGGVAILGGLISSGAAWINAIVNAMKGG